MDKHRVVLNIFPVKHLLVSLTLQTIILTSVDFKIPFQALLKLSQTFWFTRKVKKLTKVITKQWKYHGLYLVVQMEISQNLLFNVTTRGKKSLSILLMLMTKEKNSHGSPKTSCLIFPTK